MEEMMRQRNSDEESEDEEKRKQSDEKKEEATVKGRRTIDASQHGLALRAEAPAGPTEPVKFSGTTQQTVKASLSSGRTVKMSGHATIELPSVFKRETRTKEKKASEPVITPLFAVEEFPDPENQALDVNQKKDEVTVILATEADDPKPSKRSKNNKRSQAKTGQEEQVHEQEASQVQSKPQEKPAAPVALNVAHVRTPATRPQEASVPDEVEEISMTETTTGADKKSAPVRASRHSLQDKPEVADRDNPWMRKPSTASNALVKKTAHPVIAASHVTVDDKVAKSQKKKALGKRQKAETALKIDVAQLIGDAASTHVKDHDGDGDDRSSAEHRRGSSFNLLSSATEEQKELIKRAFANDDVVEEFKAAKQAEREADLPPAPKPTDMPGWGEWVGEGVVKRTPKKQPLIQKPKRPNKLPDKPPTRTDDSLDHVILNQKRDKKLARYQADQLPALYRNQPELYEAQLQMPLGREWNTQRVFDSITRPRIVTKKGHIIRPISKPIAKPKSAEEDKGEPIACGKKQEVGSKRKRKSVTSTNKNKKNK